MSATPSSLEEQRRRAAQRFVRRLEWIALSVFLTIALVGYVSFKRVIVDGISMEPTLHSGQSLLIFKLVPHDRLHTGDIIVFRHTDGKELVKRVVWVRGAAGVAHAPPLVWTPDGYQPYHMLFWQAPPVPPANTVYVMGDNWQHSEDSRDFGPIRPDQIVGKVFSVQ